MQRRVIRNTRIHFRSRKQGQSFFSNEHTAVVCGIVTPGQIMTIMGCLKNDYFFVPETVGIPFSEREPTTEEFCAIDKSCFTPTVEKETTTRTMCEIVGAFKQAGKTWAKPVSA